jgi:hypothetical protein
LDCGDVHPTGGGAAAEPVRVRRQTDPTAGSCWAKQGQPDRLPATYGCTHGVAYFHGYYSVGDDRRKTRQSRGASMRAAHVFAYD